MIINIQYKTIGNLFDVTIDVNDGTSTVYEMLPIKLGEFTYGAEQSFDTIISAKSVDLEFGIAKSMRPIAANYHIIANKIIYGTPIVTISKNGTLYFQSAPVDKEQMEFDYDNMSVKLSCLNTLILLKDIDPRTLNPADIAEPDILFNDLFPCALFENTITRTIRKVFPEFGSTFILSDIKAQTSYTFMGEYWHAPVSYFGDIANRLWGANCRFSNCLELIKAIQNTLGCIGLLIGKNYYLMPRYASTGITNQNLINISKIEIIEPLATVKGLIVTVKLAGSTFVSHYGDTSSPDNTETIDMMHSGGWIPGMQPPTAYYLPVLIPAFIAGLGNEQWVGVINKFYSSAHPYQESLWKIVGNSIWNGIVNRVIYNVELVGIDYSYDKFYTLPDCPLVFKIRKMKVDYAKHITTLDLINVATDVQFSEPTSYLINDVFGVEVNNTKLGETITPSITEGTYTLLSPFVPKSTRLYFNGVRLKPGDDYNEILPNQIQFLIDIPMDSNIIIDYEIAQ